MSEISRIGVAVDTPLLKKFDKLIEKQGYTNRSEAFRDLIRNELFSEQIKESDTETIGLVTIVYDHHRRNLVNELTALQHDSFEYIISTQHIHIDHDNCFEIIIVRGSVKRIMEIGGKLISLKGVKYGRVVPAVIDENGSSD